MADIVIDLGCKTWTGNEAAGGATEESIEKLRDWFRPGLLLAFDPHPQQSEGVWQWTETMVVARRAAAWVHGLGVHYCQNGLSSHVLPIHRGESNVETVPSFDLAELIRALPAGVVLKMDIEGAEYALLPHLFNANLDKRIARLLIEWHDGERLPQGWSSTVEKW
jgi:FkbM family methyltransferase